MIELAGLLREVAPMERAWGFFNSSGSESVESAIHLAVLYWRHLGKPSKLELISRYPSYHGSTLGALGLSGSRWRQAFELILEKNAIAQAPGADIRARRTPEAELEFGLDQIEEAIVSRGADHVAGVFIEPISGASAAAVVPPDGYLEGVRELCDRYDVLMICDETVTAFGRTGAWFGVDHWGVRPDIVTFAKGISSGMTPMSGMAVAGASPTCSPLRPTGSRGATPSPATRSVRGGGGGDPVIRDEGLVENARAMGDRLRAGLERSPPPRRTSARCAASGCCRDSSW